MILLTPKSGSVITRLVSGFINTLRDVPVPWYRILWNLFYSRVTIDGGVAEGQSCLEQRLLALEPYYQRMSLLMLPHGYRANELYSIIPDTGAGDFTFTRTNPISTRVNGSNLIESKGASIPRLDFTGVSCPELLLEPARTNTAAWSQQIDDAGWTKTNTTVIADSIDSPYGTSNADFLNETSAVGVEHSCHKITNGTNVQYQCSIFLKAGGRDFARLRFERSDGGPVYGYADVDLNLGTIINGSGVRSIVAYPNGWYRVIVTGSPPAGSYRTKVLISPDGINFSYGGVVGLGIYVWGHQFEMGSYATSYIPTLGAAITRSADTISPLINAALIGQTEGTMFLQGVFKADGVSKCVTLNDGTALNYIRIELTSSNTFQYTVSFSGGTDVIITSSAFISDTQYKIAIVYSGGYAALFVNGVKVGQDTSLTVAAMNRLLFTNQSGASPLTGRIRNVSVLPVALSDSECIALTT